MKPDATWAKMSAAAQQLSDAYCEGDTLKVIAERRSTGMLTVSEGLAVGDRWTDGFEPVRKRRIYGGPWTEVQTVEEAVARIEAFLRERPDQAPFRGKN